MERKEINGINTEKRGKKQGKNRKEQEQMLINKKKREQTRSKGKKCEETG